MADDINIIIDLIKKSPLDETIQSILIRDLESEGLTDFMREQITAYCLEAKGELKEEYEKAKAILMKKEDENPA